MFIKLACESTDCEPQPASRVTAALPVSAHAAGDLKHFLPSRHRTGLLTPKWGEPSDFYGFKIMIYTLNVSLNKERTWHSKTDLALRSPVCSPLDSYI